MRKIIIAIAFVIGLAGTSLAQSTPKFGHISSAELLSIMPEREAIANELQNYAKSLEIQMTVMQTEYKSKLNDYQMNEKTWNDLVRDSKVQEIGDLEQRIQEFQATAQKSLQEKEQVLVEPLINKANQAIQDVAKNNGYTYVFDTSIGALVVFPDGDNLLPMVKKHLSIQ